MDSKRLYIIAGCNGAGKTTASYTNLPELLDCTEFVNADEVAKGLAPFNPEKAAIQAGRLMLGLINFFNIYVPLSMIGCLSIIQIPVLKYWQRVI